MDGGGAIRRGEKQQVLINSENEDAIKDKYLKDQERALKKYEERTGIKVTPEQLSSTELPGDVAKKLLGDIKNRQSHYAKDHTRVDDEPIRTSQDPQINQLKEELSKETEKAKQIFEEQFPHLSAQSENKSLKGRVKPQS